jgi:hypothetical protein
VYLLLVILGLNGLVCVIDFIFVLIVKLFLSDYACFGGSLVGKHRHHIATCGHAWGHISLSATSMWLHA